MSWYNPQPEVSTAPLSAHELMSAKHFVHLANTALASALTKEAKRALRDVKKTASFMQYWLSTHKTEPGHCRLLRKHMSVLPKIGEVAA